MSDESFECPTCDRTDFKSESGVKIHHAQAHGESIAGVDVECDWCGSTVTKGARHVGEGEKNFCGNECQAEYQRRNWSGADHPNYNRVNVECEVCGEIVEKPPSYAEKADHHFCSTSCYGEWRSEALTGENNPLHDRKEIECAVCGVEMCVQKHLTTDGSDRVCSSDCFGELHSQKLSGADSPHWKGGEAGYGEGWNRRKKRKVRIRDQARCQHCGRTEPEHIEKFGAKHTVHHITPAREVDDPEKRNEKRNLITLCRGECHHTWEKMAPLRPDTAAQPAD